MVGFKREEIVQRLRILIGNLPDELVGRSLKLKDTRTWKLSRARQKIKGQTPENEIYPFAYRPFDVRVVCYESALIDRPRLPFMKNLLEKNLGLALVRTLSKGPFMHVFVSECLTNRELVSARTKERTYIMPLYIYPQIYLGTLFDYGKRKRDRTSNFTPKFLKAINKLFDSEPTPEEIFYYIYAVLHSSIYRKRYEEFLKIDFPRVPLPSNYEVFKELSNLGRQLVELHLLKAPVLNEAEIGFPKGGSNTMEKVSYDEGSQRVFVNKEQYFEGISKEVWDYRIGAYQVMEKYLKDRKKRKLSLDEINHYMKIAKAIQLTIELQEKIDDVYRKAEI